MAELVKVDVGRTCLVDSSRVLLAFMGDQDTDLVSEEFEVSLGEGLGAAVQISAVDGRPVSLEVWGVDDEALSRPLRFGIPGFEILVPPVLPQPAAV